MSVGGEVPIDDIVVTIGHPHGDVDVPLAQPIAAKHATTGEPQSVHLIESAPGGLLPTEDNQWLALLRERRNRSTR